jgi:DNA/RNA-binding domain of Phe-tRNA-synthetase-like protein
VPTFPPQVRHEMPGWTLFWADLEAQPAAAADLARLRDETLAGLRRGLALEKLAENPAAAAVRKLFRTAGCDPTRYRPSSEALLRRVLKGEMLPAIRPLVDLNNLLSMRLVVPACVIDVEAVEPPFVLRTGASGEHMQSLRGPFDLAGKPLLADARGVFGTPITDSERVKVTGSTSRAWLVAYLPRAVVQPSTAAATLVELLGAAPLARVLGDASTSD